MKNIVHVSIIYVYNKEYVNGRRWKYFNINMQPILRQWILFDICTLFMNSLYTIEYILHKHRTSPAHFLIHLFRFPSLYFIFSVRTWTITKKKKGIIFYLKKKAIGLNIDKKKTWRIFYTNRICESTSEMQFFIAKVIFANYKQIAINWK